MIANAAAWLSAMLPLALLLRATILIGAAWLAAACIARAGGSGAMRHLAWLLGIVTLLLFPLLVATAPALRVPILPEAARALAGGPANASEPFSFWWAWATYGVVAGLLLVRLLAARIALARIWARAAPAPDIEWRHLAAALGAGRRVTLRLSHGPVMPMTWGTLAPRILLPAEALGWPRERLQMVLMHELAHVARRDSLAQLAAAIVCALYWFHPGAWLAARRLRIEQEIACDERVLAAGAAPRPYARNLLALAGTLKPPFAASAVAMAGASQLERRLTAIVRIGGRRTPPLGFRAACAAGALLSALLVATVTPVGALRVMAAPTQQAVPAPRRIAAVPDHIQAAAPAAVVGRAPARANFQRRADLPAPPATPEPPAAVPAVPDLPAVPNVPDLPEAPTPPTAARPAVPPTPPRPPELPQMRQHSPP